MDSNFIKTDESRPRDASIPFEPATEELLILQKQTSGRPKITPITTDLDGSFQS
jgi:hypothetical protein